MVVIAMNQHTATKPGDRPAALPDKDRRPLYTRGAHWLARVAYGFMMLLYFAGVVGVLSTLTHGPLGVREAAGFLVALVFPLIVATGLRTSAIYGSVHGLEIVRWGRRRTVPWSSVGGAEYAWWSLNHAARLARLTLHEETERTILFFANDRVLADLEGMRASAAGR
jgi:hypothetical protein